MRGEMTIDGNKKPQRIPEEVQIFNDPDTNYNCDSCNRDLTHTVRIKCADRACQSEEGVDVCPGCFCAGKEFKDHKRWHAYRVIGMNARPIFTEDWGADEELLLITGIKIFGIGNWKRIAEHIGTRTKDEVASHYKEVYVDSPDWPKPKMDRHFDVEPEEFQRRKRRRITEINKLDPPPPGPAPTSLPGIHEVATFLPGRLEFEHEIDNDAEDLVKDLEFGVVYQYGGDAMPEDELDPDVRARKKWEEEKRAGLHDFQHESSATPVPGFGSNGSLNGHHTNGVVVKKEVSTEDVVMVNGTAEDENAEEPIYPPPIETQESLDFKLTLLDMYFQKVAKRLEAKGFMYDRGLLEYKKMQAAERKRPKEEREFINRLRPFARLQTSSDYEAFTTDMLYETILRKRIQELQQYRRLGLCSAADIEKYDRDLEKRKQTAKVARDYGADRRQAGSREPTPRPGGVVSANGQPARRPPAPLNLSNSPSVHLLTPAEQALCSSLRILPKPYLIIKETLVREYARRGGKLRRREARDLVKIDVNKTSRVWDFLVQAGYLKIATEINPVTTSATTSGAGNLLGDLNRQSSVNASPQKDGTGVRPSPLPPSIPSSIPSAPTVQSFMFNPSTLNLPPPPPPVAASSSSGSWQTGS